MNLFVFQFVPTHRESTGENKGTLADDDDVGWAVEDRNTQNDRQSDGGWGRCLGKLTSETSL